MSNNVDENNSYDFEASIQVTRILKILSDTIKSNMEVVFCLPRLLSNDCAYVRHFLPEDQVTFVNEICMEAVQEEAGYDTEPAIALQTDMCLVIDLLLSTSELCKFISSSLLEEISCGGKALLRSLEELRICVLERLKVTPKMEAQQDAELRRLYQQNIRNTEEVEKLTLKLKKLTRETEEEIMEKKQLIKQQIDKIAKLKKHCRDNVKKKIDDAERNIRWDIKNSEYRLDELQMEAKSTQYRREIQLKEHLSTEKDLRARRYKVESQLVALLQKYDSDIGERQALLEELTMNFQEEKEQMAILKQQFDEQEIVYVNLMEEKEQYERQQWEAKLYDIQCRVAARKIQRWYRAHLAATKTKGKKGKKGKKKK